MFVYDGTNTNLIKDLNTYTEDININSYIKFQDNIVFSGSDDRYGYELWEFNGTKVNLISDIQSGRTSSSPSNFIEMDNKLYFTCNYPSKGTELCVYDGSTVSLAADVDVGSESSNPNNLIVNGSTLYFTASTDENGNELWKYTVSGGASLVGDIFPGNNQYGNANSSSPSYLVNVGDRVYFRANNSDTTGTELYYADATGTHLAVDLYPGTYTSGSNTYQNNGNPYNLTGYNGKLYFTASLDSKGNELYVFNENNSTYSLVVDIVDGSGSSSPSYLTVVGNKLIFRANSTESGYELYTYDGTSVNLVEIDSSKDGYGNPRSSYPSNFNVIDNSLYFTANSLEKGEELYMYDGSSVTLLGDLNTKTKSYDFSQFAFYKNQLYFSGNTDNNGTELWGYDLSASPKLQSDIRSGVNSSSPNYLTKFLNKLYFRGSTDNNGTELLSFDGNNIEIIDIQPGTGSSSPSSLIGYDKELLFLASGPDGYGAYRYNGFSTPRKLPGNFSGFSSPAICNEKVYFQASGTDGSGSELWSYDGNSTKMEADIYENGSSSPSYLTCVDNKLYFKANHPDYGNELWMHEGNTTTLVSDIYPGKNYSDSYPFSSNPNNLIAVGNSLYFSAQNDVNGTALYIHDGINLSMYDNTYGKTSNSSYDLIAFDNQLYKELRDDSYKYYLSIHPNETNIGDTVFNNMSNFIVVNPQPYLNNMEDFIIDEDNTTTLSFTFDGFGDPDNRDLNITFEHNASSLMDVNVTFDSGVKTYSDYNGLKIDISAKVKENANGLVVFYVTLDNGLEKTIEKVFVQINPIDDKPEFTVDPKDMYISASMGTGVQSISAKDIDGDNITYSAFSHDTSIVTVIVNDNNVTFAPVSTSYGSTTNVDINITANGVNVGKTIQYTYIPPNSAPESNNITININEDSNYTFSLSDFNFTDVDLNYGDSLESIYITTLQSNGNLSISGTTVGLNQEINVSSISKLIFTPEPNGNGLPYATFEFKVNDGEANSTSAYEATINVTAVDDMPVIDTIVNVTGINEDTDEFNVTLSATDIDGDTITYSVKSSNTNIATLSIVDGKIVVNPIANASGTITIEVNATANGQSVLQDFNITIDPVNDKPTFETDLSLAQINEDSGVHSYELNVTDIEGSDLNITVESNNTSILTVSPSWDMNNLVQQANWNNIPLDFNLTTQENANGEVTITINVKDIDGAISTNNYTVTVNPVNDAPTLSPISNKYIYKDINSSSIVIGVNDVDNSLDELDFNATFTNNDLIKDITFNENNMTIAIEDTLSGKSDINVSVSDGEYNDSKVFSFTVLALKEDDSIKDNGTVQVDEETETVTVTFDDNKTVKAQTKPDSNNTVSHEIDLDGKVVKASSDLNGTVVEITDNGVQTKYEDTTSNIKAEVNATITGLASHVLDINGTKVEARSEFVGAQTIIKKDTNGSVEIETSVEVDNSTSIKVVAKQDGTATHTVKKGNLESKATSKVTGAKTVIDTNANVNTSVPTNKIVDTGKKYEAVAVTDANGETVTKFRLVDTTTNQEENPEPTLKDGEKFPVGSEVEIKEDENDNTVIHIQTTTPVLNSATNFTIE